MKTEKKEKDFDYYVNLNYPIKVIPYKDGGYFAEITDLPGCMTEADTLDELFEMIEDAKAVWLEVAIEDGREIKIPETEMKYSGKFLTRIPKSLHSYLSRNADEENVSLNQYVSFLLAFNADQAQFSKMEKRIGELCGSIEKLTCEFQKSFKFKLEESTRNRLEVVEGGEYKAAA